MKKQHSKFKPLITATITILFLSQPAFAQIKWFKVGNMSNKYEMSVDSSNKHDGQNVTTLRSTDSVADGFGAVMQNMKPEKYLGKRVRMSGYLKSQQIEGWAGFWFRIDQANQKQYLSFDNMEDRPITGTSDWKKYEIVLEVPAAASNIAFGALLHGSGQIWIDRVNFEIVDNSVQTTGLKQ